MRERSNGAERRRIVSITREGAHGGGGARANMTATWVCPETEKNGEEGETGRGPKTGFWAGRGESGPRVHSSARARGFVGLLLHVAVDGTIAPDMSGC